MVRIREMLDGTALLVPGIGTAKKAGSGWSVHSHVGAVWPSMRAGARPGEMTAIKQVANKRAARLALFDLMRANAEPRS